MLSIHIVKIAMRLMNYTVIIIAAGQILIIVYIKYLFKSKLNWIE